LTIIQDSGNGPVTLGYSVRFANEKGLIMSQQMPILKIVA